MNPSYRKEFRFPLELVSGIAARFLDGDNYQAAARRAVALLDACEAELFCDAVAKQKEADPFHVTDMQMEAVNKEFREFYERLPAPMKFEDAGVYVTGQKRLERALPLFRRFLKHCIRHEKAAMALGKNYLFDEDQEQYKAQYAVTPETTDDELTQRNKELPDMISGDLLHKWKGWFAEWQARQRSEVARQKGLKGGRAKKGKAKK